MLRIKNKRLWLTESHTGRRLVCTHTQKHTSSMYLDTKTSDSGHTSHQADTQTTHTQIFFSSLSAWHTRAVQYWFLSPKKHLLTAGPTRVSAHVYMCVCVRERLREWGTEKRQTVSALKYHHHVILCVRGKKKNSSLTELLHSVCVLLEKSPLVTVCIRTTPHHVMNNAFCVQYLHLLCLRL